MANPTIATQLVQMLRDAGVQRIYGVVGDSLNPIVDAVRRTPDIEWVHVSHEEGGAFAAAAEAQVTGRLAVCAGSSGPATPTCCRVSTTRTAVGRRCSRWRHTSSRTRSVRASSRRPTPN